MLNKRTKNGHCFRIAHLRPRCSAALALAIAAATWTAAPAEAQLEITSKAGSSSVKLGFLVQGRAELTDTADGDDRSQDLYLRRLRLMAGGSVTERLSFFVDTDSPNLGLGNADGSKSSSDIFIQDFVVTYSFGERLKLDGGLILVPACYNCNNSAGTLLPVDYGAFSFLSTGPTTARVGRDYGVQARGYLAGEHLEYRLGVFQGYRDELSTAPFRTTGRLMWHVWEPQKGLFYTGTSLGAKKMLAFGASVDSQDDYLAWAVDAFLDLPVAGGDALTLQADWVTYDGGDFFTVLPEQETLLLEAAWYFHRPRIGPFVQVVERSFVEDGVGADESRVQLGLAWWWRGHGSNLKLGWARFERDGAEDRDQVILQCQVFMF